VTWLPCGWLAGGALAATGVAARGAQALRIALVAAVVLVLAGAISDAATVSDPVAMHLDGQLARPGTWVAVALMGLGARWGPRGPRVASAVPSGQ